MYDAVKYYEHKADSLSTVIKKEGLQSANFVLCTIHRAENTNDPLKLQSICTALNNIHKQIQVVVPLHPRTKSYLECALPLAITYALRVTARLVNEVTADELARRLAQRRATEAWR